MTEPRRLLPSVSELLDRLAVCQIKQIKDPALASAYSEEMDAIVSDLDRVFLELGSAVTPRLVRLIVALAQINLHIWEMRENSKGDSEAARSSLRTAHQLNGIRNQLKATLQGELETGGLAHVPTNQSLDGLTGWRFSLLEGGADGT